jgi:hypothetical protein
MGRKQDGTEVICMGHMHMVRDKKSNSSEGKLRQETKA